MIQKAATNILETNKTNRRPLQISRKYKRNQLEIIKLKTVIAETEQTGKNH